MQKKYIVRLTNEERERLRSVIKKLKGSSQKVRRAQVLLKADADGPGWTDARIAEAFDCRTKTVENIRQRLVRDGFESALNGKQRESPPRAKLLDGEQEAKLIAMRLGSPPRASPTGRSGYSHKELCNWRSWIPSVRKPSARP